MQSGSSMPRRSAGSSGDTGARPRSTGRHSSTRCGAQGMYSCRAPGCRSWISIRSSCFLPAAAYASWMPRSLPLPSSGPDQHSRNRVTYVPPLAYGTMCRPVRPTGRSKRWSLGRHAGTVGSHLEEMRREVHTARGGSVGAPSPRDRSTCWTSFADLGIDVDNEPGRADLEECISEMTARRRAPEDDEIRVVALRILAAVV